MKEIKATAPTREDWIELVRENERLKRMLERKKVEARKWHKVANEWYADYLELENKTND